MLLKKACIAHRLLIARTRRSLLRLVLEQHDFTKSLAVLWTFCENGAKCQQSTLLARLGNHRRSAETARGLACACKTHLDGIRRIRDRREMSVLLQKPAPDAGFFPFLTKVRITKSEISMRTWRSPMSATLQGAFVVIPEISLCDISDIIKYCSNTNVNHRCLIYASILPTVYLIYDESAAVPLVTLVYKCIPCLSPFNVCVTRTKNFIDTCLHRSHCPICKSKCFFAMP